MQKIVDDAKEVNDAEVEKIKKSLREMLAVDRYKLLMKFPFIGNLAMHFELIPVRDVRCSTACTDGKSIYVDCDFYSSLTESDRLFVFAHEVFHNMLMHFDRRQNRNVDVFNVATDMEVNNLLSENIGNDMLMSCPNNVLFPPSHLKGKSAEVIYDYLVKKNKLNRQNGDGDGDDSSGGNSTKDTGKSSQSKSSSVNGQFDKHKYSNDPDDTPAENQGKSVSDKWGKVGLDKDFSPNVSTDASERMREAIVSAMQQHERTKGSLPSGLESLLSSLKKPQLSWRELLCNFITKCYSGEMTYLPPNRRHVYNDMYFQSRRSDKISVAVCVDTSGSCIQDLPQFFGELKGLVETFGSYEINLYMADAEIASHEVYDECNPLDIDCANDIKWMGGGGTSFEPFFRALEEDSEHETKCAIYLTDGFGDAPKDPPPYPTLWIITNDGSTDFCTWGEKIRLKDSSFGY